MVLEFLRHLEKQAIRNRRYHSLIPYLSKLKQQQIILREENDLLLSELNLLGFILAVLPTVAAIQSANLAINDLQFCMLSLFLFF